MNKEELAEKFSSLAPTWEKYVNKYQYKPVFVWLSKLCKELMKSIHNNEFKKELKIADLACGVGLISRCLSENNLLHENTKLYGIDISSGMLKCALETGLYNGGVFIQDMESKALPFSDNSISLITFCGASELMKKNLNFVIDEIYRVLQPGGRVWITFQSSEVNQNATSHQNIFGLSEEQVYQMMSKFTIKSCVLESRAFVTPKEKDVVVDVPYYFVECEK